MKKDIKLIFIILIPLILCGLVIGSFIFFYGINGRYSKYIKNINKSTIEAYNKDNLYIVDNNDEYKIDVDNIYPIYSWLIVAGPGQEKMFEIKNLDEYVTLKYPKGTTVIIGSIKDKMYICYKSVNYTHIFTSKEIDYSDFKYKYLNKSVNTKNDA